MGSRLIDLTGLKVGRLTVVKRSITGNGRRVMWWCECACGLMCKQFEGTGLRRGTTKSCGCLKVELCRQSSTTHGGSHLPEWRIWAKMRDRCLNPKNKDYQSYGGRGIYICDEWMNFVQFYEDMGQRPSPTHSLDRKDNDGPYAPWNCRWATPRTQAENRRNNLVVNVNGSLLGTAQLSEETGIEPKTLRRVLRKHKAFHKKARSNPGPVSLSTGDQPV